MQLCWYNIAVELNKHKSILRAVQSESTEKSVKFQKTGIILKCVKKRQCPFCKGVVILENEAPLSMLVCSHCGEKIMVPGRIDNFLIHGYVGEGEMGSIYRATDESLGREVAIKVVRGCHADDPAQLERLRREACAAGKLNHPRVAQVYALNFSNRQPYLVMELVAGLNFSQKLANESRIEEEEVLRMALDVAEGLSALHREGLVHGDIKPANIVLDRDGNAKLVDFGLSGMMRHDGYGNLVGTPHYLAPEILLGSADSHRTDLYSLGGTLYYLICGRLPFDGDSPEETLKARLKNDPIPLENFAPLVSSATCSMVMRLLSRKPESRYKDSDALAEDIKAALKNLKTPMVEKFTEPSSPVIEGKKQVQKLTPVVPSSESRSKGRMFVVSLLLFIALVELAVAFKQQSFSETWKWMRDDVGGWFKGVVTSFRNSDSAINGFGLVWHSTSQGVSANHRGSTMLFGEDLLVQGSGSDMWMGEENYRFFWTKFLENFSFSTKVLAISSENDFDISGLLVKNEDLNNASGVLFGFLGYGNLFLQIRREGKTANMIKCSKEIIDPPVYLKIERSGIMYTASTSADGTEWSEFAKCDTDLHDVNTIGLVVSSENEESMASAKFTDITLISMPSQIPVLTNAIPDIANGSANEANRGN